MYTARGRYGLVLATCTAESADGWKALTAVQRCPLQPPPPLQNKGPQINNNHNKVHLAGPIPPRISPDAVTVLVSTEAAARREVWRERRSTMSHDIWRIINTCDVLIEATAVVVESLRAGTLAS